MPPLSTLINQARKKYLPNASAEEMVLWANHIGGLTHDHRDWPYKWRQLEIAPDDDGVIDLTRNFDVGKIRGVVSPRGEEMRHVNPALFVREKYLDRYEGEEIFTVSKGHPGPILEVLPILTEGHMLLYNQEYQFINDQNEVPQIPAHYHYGVFVNGIRAEGLKDDEADTAAAFLAAWQGVVSTMEEGYLQAVTSPGGQWGKRRYGPSPTRKRLRRGAR